MQEIQFTNSYNNSSKCTCTLKLIRASGICEASLDADGNYYHLIVGHHTYGNYICIPNWNIGTELAALTDTFWNKERLCSVGLSKRAASSIAGALVEISSFVTL